ncbi:MAG TPA: M28 family peptidase [Rubricoccaceae bacterium]|nr:M28 family peptidase [Rubricoccaceae bacterium]
MTLRSRLLAAGLLFLAAPVLAQEPIDSAAVAFLKAEAMERGQVMETARMLTDVLGPRLTGSPQLDAAQRWAAGQFTSWGLANARLDPWGTFGRGWWIERLVVNAEASGSTVAEQTFPLYAIPKAWSPDAEGTGEVVIFNATTEEELEQYRGRLRGKIVLFGNPGSVDLGFEPLAERRDAQNLLDLSNAGSPTAAGQRRYSPEALARARFSAARLAFVVGEGPLAVLEPSTLGGTGAIRVMGASVPAPDPTNYTNRPQAYQAGVETVPQFVVLTEHYNRLVRLVEAGQRVRVNLDFDAGWTREPVTEENVIAEIPGTDPALRDEVVMLGAHLDSWHGGTGATDNAAGSAVVMEAARVLQAYYAQAGQGPRRTIRFALWTGEEQGLHGSTNYVNAHYATLGGYGEPAQALGPEHDRLSAYYNLDNGSGRIRGVYLQGNDAVRPIFRAWLDALADSTAKTLTLANTGGTDHLPFDAAGLPGFQFIQDGLAYGSQTWHTSMDTYDHLSEADLEQAAAVMATFAHHTAQRDDRLPRKPLRLAEQAATPAGTGLDEEDLHGHSHD